MGDVRLVFGLVVCVTSGSWLMMGCDGASTGAPEGVETHAEGSEGFETREPLVNGSDSITRPGNGAPGDAEPVTEPPPSDGNTSPSPESPAPGNPTSQDPAVEPLDDLGACPDFAAMGELPGCCEEQAVCVPASEVPDGLQSQVSTCDDGAACVPTNIIDSIMYDGGYWPLECVSLGGAPGVCLSTCIPRVGEFAAFLPQDVCQANERCAPCVDPLTGEDSGACGSGLDCFANVPEEPIEEPEVIEEPVEPEAVETPLSCDNPPTEAVIDPATFAPCGTAAHCVPAALVGAEDQENLATCDGGFCVPDPMIVTGGFFVPKSCTSVSGVEGRCMNTVLPAVSAEADNLPIDVCEPHERCSPCCHPMTGDSAGVCDQGCDEGPAEACTGEPLYASCCGGTGHCLDVDLVPEDVQDSLAECDGTGEEQLCVPDAMQDPNYAGASCVGNSLLLGQYGGVCLPTCLDIFLEISFDKSPCPSEHMCVPCVDPILGQPTGAPGC